MSRWRPGGIERAPALAGTRVRRVVARPRSAPAARSHRDDAAGRAGKPVRRRRGVGDGVSPARRQKCRPARRRCPPTAPSSRGLPSIADATAPSRCTRGRCFRAAGQATHRRRRPGRRSNGVTYGGNLASHRYSPADQITKDNFNQAADRLAPQNGLSRSDAGHAVLRHAAGGRPRAVHHGRHAACRDRAQRRHRRDALDAHRGRRPAWRSNAIRSGAGRGLSYWASADGADRRIIYVTPGYRLLALDAKTGVPIPAFGRGRRSRSEARRRPGSSTSIRARSASTPRRSSSATSSSLAPRTGRASAPRTMKNAKGFVRGYDVRTGRRLWIFHTIPKQGEFGYDTWLEGSAEYNGNTGAWAQMSADPELGLVYRAHRNGHRRLLRRSSSRQHALRRQHRRPRREDRPAQVALPDGASRRVGLGHPVRADAVRHAP